MSLKDNVIFDDSILSGLFGIDIVEWDDLEIVKKKHLIDSEIDNSTSVEDSEITKAPLLSEAELWNQRQLNKHYRIVFVDHIDACESGNGQIFVVSAMADSKREMLGIYRKQGRGIKSYEAIIGDLTSRGIERLDYLCTDDAKTVDRVVSNCLGRTKIVLNMSGLIHNTLRNSNSKSMFFSMGEEISRIMRSRNAVTGSVEYNKFKQRWYRTVAKDIKKWDENWRYYIQPIYEFGFDERKYFTTNSRVNEIWKIKRDNGDLKKDDLFKKILNEFFQKTALDE